MTDELSNILSKIKDFFLRLFGKIKSQNQLHKFLSKDDIHLEPKYWQEVIDLKDKMCELIKLHTIDDANVQVINQRIVDYVFNQINIKGSIENIEDRYLALDTLADRILTNSLNKIVGLKQSESSHAEFSEVIEEFKKRLHQRRQEEISIKQIE